MKGYYDLAFLFKELKSWTVILMTALMITPMLTLLITLITLITTGNWGFDDLPCVEFFCPVVSRIRLAQSDVAGVSPDDDHLNHHHHQDFTNFTIWPGNLTGDSERYNVARKTGKNGMLLTKGQGVRSLTTTTGTTGTTRTYVGMAVAFDYGDDQDHGVHSRYKSEPSRRLALQLLNVLNPEALAENAIEWSGPLVEGVMYDKDKSQIRFELTHAIGLSFQNTTACEVQYSQTCCGDYNNITLGRICYADSAEQCAIENDGETVVLASFSIVDNTLIATAAVNESGHHHGPTQSSTRSKASETTQSKQHLSPRVPGKIPKYIDFGLTDFPQCSIVNSAGLALAPFAPVTVTLKQ